jgi:heptosyltransferase I
MTRIQAPSQPRDGASPSALLSGTPGTACLLRLSAIGDVCHVVPLLRTLQRAWPQCRFTWIIGRAEHRLMSLLPEVEFITVDKRAGLAGLRALRRQLAPRRFDVLLHLQLALRASVVASFVRAPLKLGFDRARARELQWLFTNARIAPAARQHVLDSFLSFAAALGATERVLRWDLPLPNDALAYARDLVPEPRESAARAADTAGSAAAHPGTLVISPCSSHALRNWRAERYAAVADHAVRRHGMRVVLCGGPSALEREMGAAIERAAQQPLRNQIGRDTLPALLAVLARARVLLTPDSGPAHMATMVGTPVIGLYAATNPERSGPYLSRASCIDAYDRAAQQFLGRPGSALRWTQKIERPGVMDLIAVDEVCAMLDRLLASPL